MKGVIRICIFGVLLVLAGCRSESLVEADELYQENAKKIVFFENYVKNKNYKYDAEWLDYDDVSNPAIPFAQAMKVYFRDENNENILQEIANKYGRIDFEVSSPIFTDDKTGKKQVYFPILKGKEVSAVLSVMVEHDFSLMKFTVYPKIEEVREIITEFQRYYSFNIDNIRVRVLNNNDDGDGSETRPKKIKGIVVIGIGKLDPPEFSCKTMEMDLNFNDIPCNSAGGYPTNLIPPYYFDGINFPRDGGGGSPSGIDNSDFIMDPNDATKYPKFDKTVRNIKNYVASNKKVKETLIKYTGLSEKDLLSKLEYGKGPLVKITKLSDAYGYHNPLTNQVLINEKYVSQLEGAKNSSAEVLNLFLSIVLLHEFVHWTDGLKFYYWQENGERWERETYGFVVDHNNVVKLIKK